MYSGTRWMLHATCFLGLCKLPIPVEDRFLSCPLVQEHPPFLYLSVINHVEFLNRTTLPTSGLGLPVPILSSSSNEKQLAATGSYHTMRYPRIGCKRGP